MQRGVISCLVHSKFKMAGLVDTFCIQNLPHASIEFLLKCCDDFKIVVGNDKKDNKPYVLKVVLRFLTSDDIEQSADQGAAIFLKLYQALGEELKAAGVKNELNVSGTDLNRTDELTDNLSYHKLRQFKINGTIGNPGQKNCISYSSLCYQISQGEKMHYTTSEIYGGVIRAIEAGNPFRDVLELEAEDFDKAAFMRTLRSHFQIRDPNDVFNELRNCVQRPNETAHAFACRCVALRKKVQYMSETENIPFDQENLTATFFKSIYSGLRQNNIRHELRQILMQGNLADDQLLLLVSEASGNEEERVKKMKEGSEKAAKINKLTADSDSDEPNNPNLSSSELSSGFSSSQTQIPSSTSSRKRNKSKKKDSALSDSVNNTGLASSLDIGKLTAAFQEMSASNAKLTAEVNILKEMAGKPGGKNPTPRNQNPTTVGNAGNTVATGFQTQPMNALAGTFTPTNPGNTRHFVPGCARPRLLGRAPFKCNNCLYYQVPYCTHCLKCCGEGHKAKDCPVN